MTTPIVRRILDRLGLPGLVDALAALPASDLQSLLLEVARRRTPPLTAPDLLRQVERARVLRPAKVDGRLFREVERAAFAAAPGFEAVDLAPIAPFGTDPVLGRIAPDWVLPTIRNSQLLADPTSGMALECARRRRRARGGTLRLATTHRLVRMQPTHFEDHTPHFRLFALVTAGRDAPGETLLLAALREHVTAYLTLLRALAGVGFRFPQLLVGLADTVALRDPGTADAGRRLARIRDEVMPPLAQAFPEASFRIDGERRAALRYYQGPCLSIWAADRTGLLLNLGDGGAVDWMERLLSDRRERLLTSGIGLELACARFRVA